MSHRESRQQPNVLRLGSVDKPFERDHKQITMDTMIEKKLYDREERLKFTFADASTLMNDIVGSLHANHRQKRLPALESTVQKSYHKTID